MAGKPVAFNILAILDEPTGCPILFRGCGPVSSAFVTVQARSDRGSGSR
jgi:hypothetical protein